MIEYFKKKILVVTPYIWNIREYIEFARSIRVNFSPFELKIKIRFLNIGLDILILENEEN